LADADEEIERLTVEAEANAQAALDLARVRELWTEAPHRLEGSAACPHDCETCAEVCKLLGIV
jgi:hypothetical protein